MYCPDVVSLKQFYASELGAAVHALLWRRLCALWPEAKGETMLGLGFAAPYFATAEENLAIVCMPALQGALYWPVDGANRVALTHETMLPFADASFNRVLIIHTLEHSNHLDSLMRELWRVVKPSGRVIAVAPNRMSVWARAAVSPFGEGRPFNPWQLKKLLADGGFTPLRAVSSLFMPPSHWRWVLRAAPFMEMLGQLLVPLLGGVLLVEAEKQVYAELREPVRARLLKAMPSPAYSSMAPSTMAGVSN